MSVRPLILLVDDDAATCQLLAQVLQAEGYGTVAAEDADGALTRVIEGGLDAMLLDLGLPARGGLGVLALLREQDRLWNLPVVVISGQVAPDLVRNVLQAGACAYLQKPFTRDAVVRAVRLALGEG